MMQFAREGQVGSAGFVCIFYTKTELAPNSKSSDLPTQWGKGIYFAEDAAYSDGYASPANPEQNDLQPDERQMMLASLILGNTVEMDRDDRQMAYRLGGRLNVRLDPNTKEPEVPAIKAPPFLDSEPPYYYSDPVGTPAAKVLPPYTGGGGAKYNTITGFTQTFYNGRPNPACPRSRVWCVRLLRFVRLDAVDPRHGTMPACLV